MAITLEGHISIRAAIEGNSRKIYTLYIHNKRRFKLRSLIRTAQQQQIPIQYVDAETIADFASGQGHGGAVALVGERRYTPLAEIAQDVKNPFVVMLDGIEDPFNFGQSIRALYAAGVHGLIVRERDWINATHIIARASAGTSELLPLACVESPMLAITHFEQRGLSVVCTSNHDDALPLHQANLTQPMFLIIGGEKRGIAKTILHQADMLLRIPYARNFRKSLGATAATSVLVFEIARQREILSP